MSIIISKPHLCTKIPVWAPKYSEKYDEYGEEVALLHKNKVDFGSPVLIIEFTKAKHLLGQRFAIKKQDAQRHEVGTNGKAPMYIIPMSHFEPYETAQEVKDLVDNLYEENQ